MRQKRILLRLVEAVHLIDKDDGAPAALRLPDGGLLNRLADVLDAAQHRRNGDEVRVKTVGHQARQRGFANAGRAPQNAAVRLTRLKRNTQRHVGPQQMLLADHLTEIFGPQALGQWRR